LIKFRHSERMLQSRLADMKLPVVARRPAKGGRPLDGSGGTRGRGVENSPFDSCAKD
jgi:hypothetical protein